MQLKYSAFRVQTELYVYYIVDNYVQARQR
jgi:hypothetical protein